MTVHTGAHAISCYGAKFICVCPQLMFAVVLSAHGIHFFAGIKYNENGENLSPRGGRRGD